MTDRLEKIFSCIPTTNVFADIACDHGYIAKEMLSKNKCKRVIVSDISASSLSKAENLLSKEMSNGLVESFVSDGFSNIKNIESIDVALIAGLGGEEIIKILSYNGYLPNTLILQPMRNLYEVRECLIKIGYKIERDFVFKSGVKFYDLIVAKKGIDHLTEEEKIFGRTNIVEKSKDFSLFIKEKIDKLIGYTQHDNIKEDKKQEFILRAKELEKYV